MDRESGEERAVASARLAASLGRIGTALSNTAGAVPPRRVSSARTAATERRCSLASTNELFTDIASAAPWTGPSVRVNRLRLCHAVGSLA